MAIYVFIGFLGFSLTRECVGQSLAREVLYLFLCAFLLLFLARNAINCVVYFQRLQHGCFLS
jgi:hypothetical protein